MSIVVLRSLMSPTGRKAQRIYIYVSVELNHKLCTKRRSTCLPPSNVLSLIQKPPLPPLHRAQTRIITDFSRLKSSRVRETVASVMPTFAQPVLSHLFRVNLHCSSASESPAVNSSRAPSPLVKWILEIAGGPLSSPIQGATYPLGLRTRDQNTCGLRS